MKELNSQNTSTDLAALFFTELKKIHHARSKATISAKIQALSALLTTLMVEVTRDENLQFTTLFSRIAYACQRRKVSKRLQFYIHHFRKACQNYAPEEQALESLYQTGMQTLADTIAGLLKAPIPSFLHDILPGPGIYPETNSKVADFLPWQQVILTGDEPEKEWLMAVDPDNPAVEIRIRYNIPERNENFKQTIQIIQHIFSYPLTVNLLDTEIDQDGVYNPRAVLIEPDYLVDVTAIAECFAYNGVVFHAYILKKFLPFKPGIPLLVGNMANLFLDELMTNPEQSYQTLLLKAFRTWPLAFALLTDSDVRDIRQKAQKHYVNILEMVNQGFKQKNINPEATFLEPSFYAEKYGIQGRLDIFFPNKGGQGAIIELKSGKPFMPNNYGLGVNHYVQTLLYDLLVHAVYGKNLRLINYILYSGQETNILRFAPSVKSMQLDALQVRNILMGIEKKLEKLGEKNIPDDAPLFQKLNPRKNPEIKGFLRAELHDFYGVYEKMTKLERHYFLAYTGLIAREHHLAKTGIQGDDSVNGQAALWRNSLPEKEEQFDLFRQLKLVKVEAHLEDPLLFFEKTDLTNPLANFRMGDIAVLYAENRSSKEKPFDQIFKCTLVELDAESVIVRLRNRQFNTSVFLPGSFWNLEHDLIDSSFTNMYRQLFAFMAGPQERRRRILALDPPAQAEPWKGSLYPQLTEEQDQILRRMVTAPHYYLLWGPPGTGKTSVMLRYFIGHIIDQTDENILILAYTNRAVDEICEAIEAYREGMDKAYIRIGSRYSTCPAFRHSLLDQKMAKANNRQEIREILHNHRIITGTVASVSGKPEIFQLKKFQRLIIDEASQILEPAIIGLLIRFEQFVLIGDHKQLPAVVSQQPLQMGSPTDELASTGLVSLNDSLFERLIRQAQKNQWHWAFGHLSRQGRMHAAIMEFPNNHFYQNILKILPDNIPVAMRQQESLNYHLPPSADTLDTYLARERVLFLPTPVDEGSLSGKTNIHEASLIADLADRFIKILHANQLELTPQSIGIITPYRAQIAQIIQALRKKQLPTDLITVDTVERYQGGARSIILMSLCINKIQQLRSLVNLSNEGIDRKLNVALTRARDHLIVVGNPDLLKQNSTYRDFIKLYKQVPEEWANDY